jgi:ubiquilin
MMKLAFTWDTVRVSLPLQNLMREQMRTNDVAMRNIETMPGGYNQLRSMFESMNSAMHEAERAGETSPSDGPLQQLVTSLLGTGTALDTTMHEGGQETSAQGSPIHGPNSTPLPNPWQPSANAPLGLGVGLGVPPTGGATASPEMLQMMESPAIRNMMAGMLSNPQMLDAVLSSNPMMRQMVDRNPGLRSMLSNPDVVQQMMQPEVCIVAALLLLIAPWACFVMHVCVGCGFPHK